MPRLLTPFLLLGVLTGCSISIGNTAASSFRLESTGIGTSQAEAERDAWHDAADRLHSMGYSSFDLKRISLSTSTSSQGEETRVELTAGWDISDAKKSDDGACRCGTQHRKQTHNH